MPDKSKQVKRGQKKKKEESTHARQNPPMYAFFIPRVCKYLDHRGPVGGATLARWSEEKGA